MMKTHQEIIHPPSVRVGLSGMMFGALMLLLLSGCEPPAGPPGARPFNSQTSGAQSSSAPQKKEAPILAQASVAPPAITAEKSPVTAETKPTESGEPAPGMKLPLKAEKSASEEIAPQKPEASLPADGASARPSTEQRVNPLTSIFKVERAGNTVKLASELIFAQTNPFLDLLARPTAPAIALPGNPTPTLPIALPPPPDPFEHVSLTGVVYHAAAPMAVLSLDGGEAQSQLVRRGDTLMADGARMRVSRINRDSVELEMLGSRREKRTLSLPNVVGYAPAAAKAKTPEAPPALASQNNPLLPGAANMPPSGASVPDLTNLYQNLQKLTGQQPPASPTSQPPGMVLKAP